MLYSSCYFSPLGKLLILSDENSIYGIGLDGQEIFAKIFSQEEIVEKPDLDIQKHARKWFENYFSAKNPSLEEISLAPQGSDFRKKVWKILTEIPYGEVITYGEIAKKLAVKLNKEKMSSQAVGNAIANNPILIMIPCHRVIGANGNLTGFSAGINNKARLLEFEGHKIQVYNQKFYVR